MSVFNLKNVKLNVNDMFAIDMESEFERQSFQFVRDNNSRTDLNPSSMEAIPINNNLEEQQLQAEQAEQQQQQLPVLDEENKEQQQ